MSDDDQPLAAFVCAMPGNRFSSRGVLLAFGQASDGAIVHVDRVPRGLACGCVCPACRSDLVAHQGPKVLHHFAHYAVGECRHAGETALHKYAKQLLDEQRVLVLPPQQARAARLTLDLHPGGEYSFDGAVLEQRLGDIVPDVVLRKGDRELLVEFAVTHKCDDEKIAKITALGISAVEIDLSGLPPLPQPEEVADGILRTAPRRWLANPRIDAGQSELKDRIERRAVAERAEAERKIRALVAINREAKVAVAAAPRAKQSEVAGKVATAGYGKLIGIAIEGDFCFRADRRHWQAVIFDRFVLGLIGEQHKYRRTFRSEDVWRHVVREQLLRPALRSAVDSATVALMRQTIPDYQSPHLVAETYLQQLAKATILNHDGDTWTITDQARKAWAERQQHIRQRRERREQVEETVAEILRSLPEEEAAGFDYAAWFTAARPEFGISFRDAIATDDKRYWQLYTALCSVQFMILRQGELVDELLGLPLSRARERIAEERRREEERKRREAEAAERERAERRVTELRVIAIQCFGGANGEGWATTACPGLANRVPIDVARESREGFEVARSLAEAEFRRRTDEFERQVIAESARAKLTDAAARAFGRFPHASLFLNSGHPSLKGMHPLDYCVDDTTLATCLTLLPRPRR